MTDFETIRTETREHVGIITIDRPDALNALDTRVMREVVAAAESFDADDGIGAIIVTGSERAFAAGADIREMAALSHAELVERDLFADWDRLLRVRIPVIAVVSGYALGGGCELALMCDTVYASETAQFGLPEITLGVIPGIGGAQRLPRAVGKAAAMDLVLTGRRIGADEALSLGIVARVLPAESLLDDAVVIAEQIARRSRFAVAAAKEAVNRSFESPLSEGLRAERRSFEALFALPDRAEGMAAFLQKREADFGR